MINKQSDKRDISILLDIMARLRDPRSGCPWDLEQNFASIAPYTIEEAYEVADAIERDALAELPGELGDLLLQVVFHAQMGSERGEFDFGDVVAAIVAKMIRRHPHVFGDENVTSVAEQSSRWEAIKQAERPARTSVLADVPLGMPGLSRAMKLGRRASAVGFDWQALPPVRAKVAEELDELDEAVAGGDPARIQAEMGDLLFALANLCRHLDIDAEQCLRGANERFTRRFGHVQAAIESRGGDWRAFDAAALDALWEAAKADLQD
jgi:MazG family protein